MGLNELLGRLFGKTSATSVRNPRPPARNRPRRPATPPPPAVVESARLAAKSTESDEDTVEPVTRAFPVHGLPPGRAGAGALEQLLRRVRGVTTAYVSPVTALAYLAYHPKLVTEKQLVQAIRGYGYQVGAAAQRFDWRHAQKPGGTTPAQTAGGAQ